MSNTTIWKFPLQSVAVQTIELPAGFDILTVQVQNGAPCLWAAVDPDAQKTRAQIRIIGTGHDVPTPALDRYIGTFQIDNGKLVFHVFERLP